MTQKRRTNFSGIIQISAVWIGLLSMGGLSEAILIPQSFTKNAVEPVAASASESLPCDSPVFCHGSLLQTVQMMRLFNDSKSFVDLPLRYPVNKTLTDFAALGDPAYLNATTVRNFVESYFDPLDSDLEVHTPSDFKNVTHGGLPFAAEITDSLLKDFAVRLHNKWRDLGRKISSHASDFPEQHSIISVPHPFIVPGGRFDEIYYWDSYWVMEGLLASNMPETVAGMLRNFAYLIDKFGHILNGNRVYYSKRSQPPFFALMAALYFDHYNVQEPLPLIRELLPVLKKEHDFWMTKRAIDVTVSGKTHKLNVYRGDITHPRPESYFEDHESGQKYLHANNKTDASFVFTNIAAAAESGWDFSTRWLDTRESEFYTIRTETIVPVDLNSVICAQEQILSRFYNLTGDTVNAEKYRNLTLDRGDAVEAVFWNEAKGVWFDYDSLKSRQLEHFYLSGVVPIFTRCNGRDVNVTSTQRLTKVLNSQDVKGITAFSGGFPCSLYQSPTNCCQWDLPNAWAPLQLMLIEGFAQNTEMRAQAIRWAQTWVSAVYKGEQSHGRFYEKYHANFPGQYGSGGEYVVQEGFGWTNGGILRLLEMFPKDLKVTPVPSSAPVRAAPVSILTFVFLIIFTRWTSAPS
ncbi:trehalase-like [Paramacrobiotus metropolitanus]|uniref:trehalase-like n=1 Tax=Paramacrobiotus metropolitanus TaxID=2943436 RepID=UPI00244594D1|nr:trehalase-like [Paramacrobiotus metropolitanus]